MKKKSTGGPATTPGEFPSGRLCALVANREDWLIRRVLFHAKKHHYTEYTSTLEEAWRASVSGLSAALTGAVVMYGTPPELGPDDDYVLDPIASFGILEARRHRGRGVSLGMFMGLMKYYKQSYLDLLREGGFNGTDEANCRLFVERFLDRVEIGFCVEWSLQDESGLQQKLQAVNRTMTNEKNRYLTIFESTPTPVFFLDEEMHIENMNHSAAVLLHGEETPGSDYYGEHRERNRLPWIVKEIEKFLSSGRPELTFEREATTAAGHAFFEIKLERMLDVSEKFGGVALILNDITQRKTFEDKIHKLSIMDELTGLYNRRGFVTLSEQHLLLARRNGTGALLLFIDADGLKEINDTFGHKDGDRALCDIADVLRSTFRCSDIIGRIGGDEFAVLETSATSADPGLFVAKLEDAVGRRNALNMKVPDVHHKLSLSIGVASFDPRSQSTLEELMSAADELMYHNKRTKREHASSLAVIPVTATISGVPTIEAELVTLS